ncbi:unnamed protein product [Paramecium pentaurelia]|uniref:Uncharacterized protein n=1 Tax=Paramecium pentaurelia TaxID=43138 RepID=A0A8S1YIE4_9CILI|nr:unnamed protein product [Paramecium pentaurelia]
MNLTSSKENEYFHKIAAHKLIRYYEKLISQQAKQLDTVMFNEKLIKELDIINLSFQNQILCSKTAFICEVCQNEQNLQHCQRKRQRLTNVNRQRMSNRKRKQFKKKELKCNLDQLKIVQKPLI